MITDHLDWLLSSAVHNSVPPWLSSAHRWKTLQHALRTREARIRQPTNDGPLREATWVFLLASGYQPGTQQWSTDNPLPTPSHVWAAANQALASLVEDHPSGRGLGGAHYEQRLPQ